MNYKQMSIEDMRKKGLTCDGEEEIGSALININEIHGSRFVFSKNKFLGLFSSYHNIYRKQQQPSTKVKHAVLVPLNINEKTKDEDVFSYAAGERVYTLPFYKKGKIDGVITARSLADKILKDSNLLEHAVEGVQIEPIVTAEYDAKVREVYPVLKKGVEQVIVIDKSGAVKGVVTRNDLKHMFIHPTDRQRFHKNGNRPTDWAFDEEKIKRFDDPLKNYLNPQVNVIYNDEGLKQAAQKVLKSPDKPLVILNESGIPIGIINFRNFLIAASKKKKKEVNLIFKKPSKSVSLGEFEKVYKDVEKFALKMNKRMGLEKIEVKVEEPKYPNHKTAVFNTTLILVPYGKGQIVAKAKEKTYTQSIKSAMKQSEKQKERDHEFRSNHHHKSLGENSLEFQTAE